MFGKLIWRNVKRRTWQSVLTFFVVAACTAALAAGILLVWGIEKGGKNTVDNLGADILVIPADADFEPSQVLFTGAPANSYIQAGVMARVKEIPGVEAATAQFFSQTLNQSCCSLPEEYRLVGYDPETDFIVDRLLAADVGRALKPNEVIVGGKVPAFLGDRVVILGKAFDVAGYLKPMGGSIDGTIFVPIETARRLAGASPYLQMYWEKEGDPAGLISAILIKTADGADPEAIAGSIAKIAGVKGVTAGRLFRELQEQLTVIKEILRLMLLIICGITIASLSSRYSSLVMERQQELAILRALGTERSGIFRLVMLETGCLGLAGSLFGCLAGCGMVYYLEKVIRSHSNFPFLLPSTGLLSLILLGVIMGVLLVCAIAAFWPARVSAGMDPIIALTEGEMK